MLNHGFFNDILKGKFFEFSHLNYSYLFLYFLNDETEQIIVIKLLNYQQKKKNAREKKQKQEHLEVSFKYRENRLSISKNRKPSIIYIYICDLD